ncbi:MAG: Hint domain-containing protein [Paracoccaceae bacterium]
MSSYFIMIKYYKNTFIIPWSQSRIDGMDGAELDALRVGSVWSWRGGATCIDGPNDVLRLADAFGSRRVIAAARRRVRRTIGPILPSAARRKLANPSPTRKLTPSPEPNALLDDRQVVFTDGLRTYAATLIETPAQTLLMFSNILPPKDVDLIVVQHTEPTARYQSRRARLSQICGIARGTEILTPSGPLRSENLRVGDLVHTKDAGHQAIRWVATYSYSAAQLASMPAWRPVRVKAGALGDASPRQDLWLAPHHRLLVRGSVAHKLFNTTEVLVPAQDLVNGDTIVQDVSLTDATYHQLMLGGHHVLSANGADAESFHPADATLSALSNTDKNTLLATFPKLETDPHAYGAYARRNLSMSEAAILRHAA